jgi:hypothetical protein
VNRQSRWWHQPSVEPGGGDDPFFGKETRLGHLGIGVPFWESFGGMRHCGWRLLNSIAEARAA